MPAMGLQMLPRNGIGIELLSGSSWALLRREDPGALPTVEWLLATVRQEESADLLAVSQASCARDKTTVNPKIEHAKGGDDLYETFAGAVLSEFTQSAGFGFSAPACSRIWSATFPALRSGCDIASF